MTRLALLLGVCSLLLTSCGRAWDAVNRDALRDDVAHVLSVDPAKSSMRCGMVDATRSGYCLLPADASQVSAWSRDLGLDARTASQEDVGSVPPLASEGPVGCLDPGIYGPIDGLPAYWIGGRPNALGLSGGGQFEYLLLLFDEAASQACVQVSYAYG